jgi:DNA-binding MarR family transcriptional regulator
MEESIMNEKIFFEKILNLRWSIEHNMFKMFVKSYDMPKGIKQTHAIAMMITRHRDKISMSELSNALNLEKGSFTTVADKLLKLGYVESHRGEDDRRKYYLKLTEKGLEFTEKFGSSHMDYVENIFSGLNNDRREELISSLNKVEEIFKEVGIAMMGCKK